MQENDVTEKLQQQVQQAIETKQPINIRGGGSKQFLGLEHAAALLEVSAHSGIITYEPSELVITARAGTRLADIHRTLKEHGQMLAFEPPNFNSQATIGGCVATALSGPGRPYLGAVRDHVLGCRMINGHGQVLRFGGEVMKNVAGYDVTRLMTGAMGTLGLLLDVSLKVIPVSDCESTVCLKTDVHQAIERMQRLASDTPLVTASAWYGGELSIRLAGVTAAVAAATAALDADEGTDELWDLLRDHSHPYFRNDTSLWRISVPALTPELDLSGDCFYEWAGMQRWLYSDEDAQKIRLEVKKHGGHATLFRATDELKQQCGTFQQPDDAIMRLHKNVKLEFDPHGIFNPGRLYADL